MKWALVDEGIRGVAPLRKWCLALGLETSVIFAMRIFAMRSRIMLFHVWKTVGASRQKIILVALPLVLKPWKSLRPNEPSFNSVRHSWLRLVVPTNDLLRSCPVRFKTMDVGMLI